MDQQQPQEQQQQEQPQITLSTIERDIIQAQIVEGVQTCFDPEIPVNIYDLGLIYDVQVNEQGGALIYMTLTSPHCPAAQSLPSEVKARAQAVPGVTSVEVKVVWEPPWNPSMMSEAAKLELGMF